jgi:hypothetical protein
MALQESRNQEEKVCIQSRILLGSTEAEFLGILSDVSYADIPPPAAVAAPSVEVPCNGITVSSAGLVLGGFDRTFPLLSFGTRRSR